MSVRVRETSDHVNGDMSPRSFGDRIWVQRGSPGLCARLRLLTSFAAFDVGFDILLDLWPPEFAEY